jgi:hypothetical protein
MHVNIDMQLFRIMYNFRINVCILKYVYISSNFFKHLQNINTAKNRIVSWKTNSYLVHWCRDHFKWTTTCCKFNTIFFKNRKLREISSIVLWSCNCPVLWMTLFGNPYFLTKMVFMVNKIMSVVKICIVSLHVKF